MHRKLAIRKRSYDWPQSGFTKLPRSINKSCRLEKNERERERAATLFESDVQSIFSPPRDILVARSMANDTESDSSRTPELIFRGTLSPLLLVKEFSYHKKGTYEPKNVLSRI